MPAGQLGAGVLKLELVDASEERLENAFGTHSADTGRMRDLFSSCRRADGKYLPTLEAGSDVPPGFPGIACQTLADRECRNARESVRTGARHQGAAAPWTRRQPPGR